MVLPSYTFLLCPHDITMKGLACIIHITEQCSTPDDRRLEHMALTPIVLDFPKRLIVHIRMDAFATADTVDMLVL